MESKPDNIFDVTPRFLGELESWLVQKGFLRGKFSQGLLASLAGYKFAYNEFTSNVAITALTEATANTIVSVAGVQFDGATEVVIDFRCVAVHHTVQFAQTQVVVFDGATAIGQIGLWHAPDATTYQATNFVPFRMTPTAGTHTFSICAFTNVATASFIAGPGGAGNFAPGFIRVTRA